MDIELSGRLPGSGIDARPSPARLISRASLLLSMLCATACGGARLQPGTVSSDLGHGSRRDLDQAVLTILQDAGYTIRNHWETPSRIYYETEWVTRKPFHDEVIAGADLCRTRIIIEATQERPNIYGVRLRAENASRSRDVGGWSPVAVTGNFQRHVDEIASEITMRIDAGVRTY